MSDELTQWLRTQLDTDAIKLTDPYQAASWHNRGCESVPDILYPDREPGACDCGVPEQVLRDIDAKRRLLAEYIESEQSLAPLADMTDVGRVEGLRVAVAHMALPYADRSGYREQWRP